MSASELMDQSFRVMFSGLKGLLDVGRTICIEMPRKVVIVCLTIQKELVLLPFRSVRKIYEILVKPPLKYLLRVYQKEDPTPVEFLTGEPNPSPEKIIDSARDIRYSAIKVINNENNVRSQVLAYKEQLNKWKQENEKRTESIYKISIEEKELMKAIAAALRYIRSLKAKREKIDESFNKSLNMNSGTVSSENIVAMIKQMKKYDDVINEKKIDCLNMLKQGRIQEKNINVESNNEKYDKEMNIFMDNVHVLSPSEAIQKVFSMVVDENVKLKNRLASTHRKLEEILHLSENINKEIVNLSRAFEKVVNASNEKSNLQQKLDEEREMLKAVEADRDRMKYKLEALEMMIKEEEVFLEEIFQQHCEERDVAFVSPSVSQFDVL